MGRWRFAHGRRAWSRATALRQIQRGVALAVRARPNGPGAIAPVADPARPGAAEKVELDRAIGPGQRAGERPMLRVQGASGTGTSRARFSIPIVPREAGGEAARPPAKGGPRR